jgi:hypothetical protein
MSSAPSTRRGTSDGDLAFIGQVDYFRADPSISFGAFRRPPTQCSVQPLVYQLHEIGPLQ